MLTEAIKPKSNTIAQARQFVLNLHNKAANAKLLYHNYAQTAAVVEQVEQLSNTLPSAKPEVVEIALLAAYFHQVGYLKKYQNPQEASKQLAQQFLTSINYSSSHAPHVLRSIEASFEGKAHNIAAALLVDALHYVRYGEQYNEWSGLLRIEQELMLDKTIPKKDWQAQELQTLLQVQFYTPHGKTSFAPLVGQNIVKQKNRVDKAKVEAANPSLHRDNAPFTSLPITGIDRGAQTFFRTTFRTHINLSAIAVN
ncbi:MAG: hypothetical protein AAF738_10550, partial [Bacteroidota bacterium]